jgi:hypothetical protein
MNQPYSFSILSSSNTEFCILLQNKPDANSIRSGFFYAEQ